MREDLVSSAESFLHETQNSDATLESKLEFLKTKGLTQEEIDESLRRVHSSASPVQASSVPVSKEFSENAQQRIQEQYVRSQWPEYANRPPPIPRRDWKDFFVMATVSVGVAYGIFEVVRRYVIPAIKPPPPGALEADKQALAAEFDRAEAIIEQIQKDTEELKQSEQERASAFEILIQDARSAVADVRSQSEERKQDLVALKQSIQTMQEQLPRAIQRNHELQEEALKFLGSELKSLKALIGSRAKGHGGLPSASMVPSTIPTSVSSPMIHSGPPPGDKFVPEPAGASKAPTTATLASDSVSAFNNSGTTDGSVSNSALAASKPGIPAWQLASQNPSGN